MMKKKTRTGKKKNPQDTTLRNVRATSKRIADLALRLSRVETRVADLEDAVNPPEKD
jgi:hypothetical protein